MSRSNSRQSVPIAVPPVRIGCAGWRMPPEPPTSAPPKTHLARYAEGFTAVEINSSFHRPHRRATYARWAATVGPDFRFSVKVPKSITHTARLEAVEDLLAAFLDEVGGLNEKLGCLLVQLPPSLPLLPAAETFFRRLRGTTATDIVCEPRNVAWFTVEADQLFAAHRIGRVIADPPCDPRGPAAANTAEVCYVRLHGSPQMYYSPYDDAALDRWAAVLNERRQCGCRCWCIFDNTAAGHAFPNAVGLRDRFCQ